MKLSIKIISLIILTCVLFTFVTACSKTVTEEKRVKIALMNKSAKEAYLWLGHASEYNPGNLVPASGMQLIDATVKAAMPIDKTEKAFLDDNVNINAATKDGEKSNKKMPLNAIEYKDNMTIFVSWDGKDFSVSDKSN